MSSANSPCAACKFLRQKCTQECVFAPYFPPDQPQKFANVHRMFGASNISKILKELHPAQRDDAVSSLAYEAEARLQDPVYGCVGLISILQHRIRLVQQELFNAKSELANYVRSSTIEAGNRVSQQPLQPANALPYNMEQVFGLISMDQKQQQSFSGGFEQVNVTALNVNDLSLRPVLALSSNYGDNNSHHIQEQSQDDHCHIMFQSS